MRYIHRFINGDPINFHPGKAICIGRNYVDHIKELKNQVPDNPLLFMKPTTAFCEMEPQINIPDLGGQCHHELEIAILIGETIKSGQKDIKKGILGVGLALDLTMRDLQNELKKKGHPWEIAKGFDNSCPLTPFVPIKMFPDLKNIGFQLSINGELVQDGNSSLMITAVDELIRYAAGFFTLMPGDVVLTGTPAGVSALSKGNLLGLNLNNKYHFKTIVK